MPVQQIELEEVTMFEVSDEALEAAVVVVRDNTFYSTYVAQCNMC